MKQCVIALFGFLVIAPVNAASFDCTKSQTKVEKLMCSDDERSELDDVYPQQWKKFAAGRDDERAQAASTASVTLNELLDTNSGTRAVVVLEQMYAPLSEAGPFPLPEEEIRKTGCEYETKDPALIASLISILKARTHVVSQPGEGGRARELVTLTFTNGRTVELLFGILYSNIGYIRGGIVRDTLREVNAGTLLNADVSLAKALYGWTLSVEQRMPAGERHSAERCGFVRNYHDNVFDKVHR